MIWACNGSHAQIWTIEGNGTIRINGKCLDIVGQRTSIRVAVDIWTCTGRANQQWRPEYGTLVNPASGKCLDDPRFDLSNGTRLFIFYCNGGSNQQWKLGLAGTARSTATGAPTSSGSWG